MVARLVFCQQNQMTGIFSQEEFASGNGFDHRETFGYRQEFRNTGERSVVRDGQPGHMHFICAGKEFFNIRHGIEGILRVYV